MVDTLGRGCWVLRRQSYEIMKALRDFSPGDTERNAKFLLSGGDGCGKSLCLSQVVHWGVKSGWTVIHVPSVFLWTHSKEEVRSSMKHPGTYDQPKEAVTWLKNFKSLNSEHLSQIQLSKDHSWTKREKSEAGDSLTKVIEQGLLHPPIATEIVGVVLEEVAMEANKSKTLLAVDDFDGCFNPTFIKLGRNEWAEPDQLNLVKYLVSAVSPEGHFPGGVVLALARAKMSRHHQSPLKDEGLDAAVAGFTKVEVPEFDRRELDNCIKYYIQEKWLNKVITPDRSDELWCLSSGNPAELHRLCAAL